MVDQNAGAYQIGAIVGALMIGAIIGAIPLTFGRKREDEVVGTVGFVACMAGGFISGILGAGSMAVGFVIAILLGGRRG
jgi:hypothetical protein